MAAWIYIFVACFCADSSEKKSAFSRLFHAFYSAFVWDGRAWLGDWSGGVGGVTGTKARGIASPRACFLVEVPTAGVITTDHHRLHFIDFDRAHQF